MRYITQTNALSEDLPQKRRDATRTSDSQNHQKSDGKPDVLEQYADTPQRIRKSNVDAFGQPLNRQTEGTSQAPAGPRCSPADSKI